ncbi:hypothetical protein CBL_04884 [Carabus blaptoides fortunei]
MHTCRGGGYIVENNWDQQSEDKRCICCCRTIDNGGSIPDAGQFFTQQRWEEIKSGQCWMPCRQRIPSHKDKRTCKWTGASLVGSAFVEDKKLFDRDSVAPLSRTTAREAVSGVMSLSTLKNLVGTFSFMKLGYDSRQL